MQNFIPVNEGYFAKQMELIHQHAFTILRQAGTDVAKEELLASLELSQGTKQSVVKRGSHTILVTKQASTLHCFIALPTTVSRPVASLWYIQARSGILRFYEVQLCLEGVTDGFGEDITFDNFFTSVTVLSLVGDAGVQFVYKVEDDAFTDSSLRLLETKIIFETECGPKITVEGEFEYNPKELFNWIP